MDYSRQQLIEGLEIPPVASVVGCGGTGFWTAYLLAMQGTKEVIVFDTDTVEESNLARLPIPPERVGSTKLDSLEYVIGTLRSIRLEKHFMKIEKPEDCAYLRGVVFCCTDNIPSQQLVCAYCRKNSLPYQRVGYDGTILNVSRGFPLTFDDPNSLPPGYEVTPSWVVPAVMAAAAGISSQCLQGGKITLMDDIRRLHIQDCSNMSGDMVEKLKKEGRKDIEANPSKYAMGYCEDCDRGICEDCEGIPKYNYDGMRDIVCNFCDYRDPDDIIDEIIQEIRDGNMASDLKAAIESKYTITPI